MGRAVLPIVLLTTVASCGRLGFGEVDFGDGAVPDGVVTPTGPLVTTFQPADLVLGQPDFETGTAGPVSATSLNRPEGIASDGTRLWIHDNGNARILMWNTIPTTSQAPANLVLGQTTMTDNTPGYSATKFAVNGEQEEFDGTFVIGDRLYSSNHNTRRVMVWDPLPTTNGEAMKLVLGADNFTSPNTSNPAVEFGDPTGVWSDGNQLLVSDIHKNRLLIWPTIPQFNGTPASRVLGQETLADDQNNPPTASTMREPHGVLVHEGRLYVADTGHHRILGWHQIPTENGAPADFVIGQPDFTSKEPNVGGSPSASTLSSPIEMRIVDDHMFVSDWGNNRVLVYSPVPTATGAAAIAVLGQPDLTTADLSPPPAANRFAGPVGLFVVGNALFVSDIENHRVLRFTLAR